MERYPKRLIEVDLPIKRISKHSRREKDMRRGHVPLLHIWPATRPTAACRAIICALLWLDPLDSSCPESFRQAARKQMQNWASQSLNLVSDESVKRFVNIRKSPEVLKDNFELRMALLDFIADFSNWDNSTIKEYLETSRELTRAAHKALGGAPGTLPLLVDPFAGGGAIPLEALRIGAEVFASDLNPVSILIQKMVLEYVPKFGQELIKALEQEVKILSASLKDELTALYPSSPKKSPVAYIWARTVTCEGPGCGVVIPLIRSQLLVRKNNRFAAIKFRKSNDGALAIDVIQKGSGAQYKSGTVRRGAAICPLCGYTTPTSSIRRQLTNQSGGAANAKMLCVVEVHKGARGRFYRSPHNEDVDAILEAKRRFKEISRKKINGMSAIPDETLHIMSGVFNAPIYGHSTWGSLFTPRQSIYIYTCVNLIKKAAIRLLKQQPKDFADAIITGLSLLFDKMVDMNSALCGWQPHAEIPAHTFARWALPMVWDFAETNPLASSSGSPESALKRTLDGLSQLTLGDYKPGNVQQCSATAHPLPDNSAALFVTDPPYYNAVPYADLSDFFYVWLRRVFSDFGEERFAERESPKDQEICEMAGWDPARYSHKDALWFENQMKLSMAEGRRILSPGGVGLVVFAHKSTKGWEAQLNALISAGWVVTGSWPIDTEMASRMRAMNSAVLASSIHLVCRPRIDKGIEFSQDNIGYWREVLQELPKRIHEWMPRLAEEGVVGADAIFACLGPAIEIFSRYSRVEKASGETVALKEYLEQVWAAVAKEALKMIFEGADATGFEEDARLTAMWLWTLKTSEVNGVDSEGEESEVEYEDGKSRTKPVGGSVLEYDAARKIAQGLGAHLENLNHLVAIQGETAVLLRVADRSQYLFGKDSAEAPKLPKRRAKQQKLNFDNRFQEIEKETGAWVGELSNKPGRTVLDQLHQSMILFAAGRLEALKRFLVEDGIGSNPLIWRLAQALSALYPSSTDEKRWVDGVMARKKGLGF